MIIFPSKVLTKEIGKFSIGVGYGAFLFDVDERGLVGFCEVKYQFFPHGCISGSFGYWEDTLLEYKYIYELHRSITIEHSYKVIPIDVSIVYKSPQLQRGGGLPYHVYIGGGPSLYLVKWKKEAELDGVASKSGSTIGFHLLDKVEVKLGSNINVYVILKYSSGNIDWENYGKKRVGGLIGGAGIGFFF